MVERPVPTDRAIESPSTSTRVVDGAALGGRLRSATVPRV